MSWTPPKLVKWITDDLKKKGFPEPHRFQAEQLVSHALKISRLDIYLQHDKPCTPDEQLNVRELVKRRYKNEPAAYIIGNCDFWSLTLEVGPGVLIPRPDTEILVEAALSVIPCNARKRYHILELGTGTAAIPLAICSERSSLDIYSTDCSSKALKYAKKNITLNKTLTTPKDNHIHLIQADRFSSIKSQKTFDLIISNPPYIPEDQIKTLQKEVCDWEPSLALAGGKYGLDFYEYLMDAATYFLKPEGHLIFEHGFDQSKKIINLIKTHSHFKLVESCKDYSGHDRVLIYQNP